MKIVFLSNYYNHHQAYLSRKLYELTDGNYKFIASTCVSESRKKLGYVELKDDFVISYDGTDDVQYIIDSADIAIIGSAPEVWIENRKKQGKLIFRCSERPLKKGFQLWKYPYRFLKWHKQNPRNARIYMLCSSAYTAADYSNFGLFKDKCFKWGYFPECKYYESVEALMGGKIENEMLWCGRFLDWKHPDDVLTVAKRLKEDGRVFHINIIGTGEMQNELELLRDQYELSEYVTFVGSVSADKVRAYMEKASIYLFTSDKQEGWGAVLNEAMNSGCADAITVSGAKQRPIVRKYFFVAFGKVSVDCLTAGCTKIDDPFLIALTDNTNAVFIDICQIESNQLAATDTAIEKKHQNCIVSNLVLTRNSLQKCGRLLQSQIFWQAFSQFRVFHICHRILLQELRSDG